MSTLQTSIQRGVAASRPAAASTPIGALYFSTDTGVTERNNGTTWDIFAANYACLATKSAVQSLTNNTTTVLTFDTETYDNNTMHDNVTNNSRITFTTAGRYLITVYIEYASNATGYRYTDIRLNGATIIGVDSRAAVNTDTSNATIVFPYQFAAADYIEARGFQNSGGNLNVAASTRFGAQQF